MEKMNRSTQCNLFLFNRTKLKEKGVNCSLTNNVKTKQEGKLKNLAENLKVLTGVVESSKPKVKSKQVQCNLNVDFNNYLKTATTQTDNFCGTDLKGRCSNVGTQCGGFSDQKGLCIEKAVHVLQSTDEFSNLDYQINKNGALDILKISRCGAFDVINHTDPVSISLDSSGICKLHVVFKTVETYTLLVDGLFDIDSFCSILHTVADRDFVFCSGISNMKSIDCHVNSVVTRRHPYLRYQSRKCKVWFKKSSSLDNKNKCPSHRYQCLHCRHTSKYLSQLNKRKKFMTPSKKIKRVQINSNYSIERLTPRSKRRRLIGMNNLRQNQAKRIVKLELQLKEKDVVLNKSQSCELQEIVNKINLHHKTELDKVLAEQEQDKQELLKQTWERDSKQRQVMDTTKFFNDQVKNTSGNRRNIWSPITYRIALAVYSRSKSAYSALKSFNILQLPSIKSLQNKSGKFLDPPGINHSYLEEQSQKYMEFQKEKMRKGETVPAKLVY